MSRPYFEPRRLAGLLGALAALAILPYAVLLGLQFALAGSVDHDEHFFMAGAFLMAHEGLQPYRDFPYFHMPNLAYVYAGLSWFSQPFLITRIFVGLCAGGICIVLFAAAQAALAGRDRFSRLVVPAAGVAMLVFSPLFKYTAAHVWNHTPSALFAIAAVLLHLRALRGNHPARMFLFSGAALGMALGIRLSYAPLIFPFLLAIPFVRGGGGWRGWIVGTAMFALGGLLANLPSLYFFVTDHERFLFGNLGYAELNTLYRKETNFPGPMTLEGKFQAMRKFVYATPPHAGALFLTVAQVLLLVIDAVRSGRRPDTAPLFSLLVLPFVLWGALAPTPVWYQYFFATIPFLILFSIVAASSLRSTGLVRISGVLFLVAAIVSFNHFSQHGKNPPVKNVFNPDTFYPVRLHQEASTIRALVESGGGHGPVLTLSPLYVTESGLSIYREFAMGPFAWRTSHLIPEDDALRLGLPLRARIVEFIRINQPRAILTGMEHMEPALEEPIVRAAQELGYLRREGPGGAVVWLRADGSTIAPAGDGVSTDGMK